MNLELYKIKERSNRLAVEFLNYQVAAQQAIVSTTIGALMMANTYYYGILGLTDAKKLLSFDLLLSFASIALPGLGPIAKGIEEWQEKGSRLKKFIGHIGGNASDYYGLAETYKEDLDSDDGGNSLNVAQGNNDVIREALRKAYQGLGEALILSNKVIPDVINKNLSDTEVKTKWLAAGLPVVNGLKIGASLCSTESFDLMVNVLLYDMLRNYTGKYVSYRLYRSPKGGIAAADYNYEKNKELPEDGNAYGEFTGMTQATRDAIYARFGGFKGMQFSLKARNRPRIGSYRDMVDKWSLAVGY